MSFHLDSPIDTRIFRDDGTIAYCTPSNKLKELWQRDFIQWILDNCFSEEENYFWNDINGLFADLIFDPLGHETGIELKNVDHRGKEIGEGFTRKDILGRFTGSEDTKALLLSCSDLTVKARELLEEHNIHYAILPFQTTLNMSFKEWVKNKRVAIAFFSKIGLRYKNPFKKTETSSELRKASISIRSVINIICYIIYSLLDSNCSVDPVFLTSEHDQTMEKSLQEGELCLDSMHQLKDSSKCQLCGNREGTNECKICEVMYCEKCYEFHQREHRTKGRIHPSILWNMKRAAIKRKQQGLNNIQES